MISKRIEDIGAEDVQALVDNAVPESHTLDYKAALPGNADADRKEFLADVSAFANSGGGDIVFGVSERRQANQNSGIPDEAIGIRDLNPDSVTLQLQTSIRNGIDPRIAGIQIKCVGQFRDGPVVILRIPRSWVAPHMVTYKGTSRFYSRTSAGKYQLDVREIRTAFESSASVPERIHRFRQDRLSLIAVNDGPVTLPSDSQLAHIILHLYPLSALSLSDQVDIVSLKDAWPPISLPGFGPRTGTSATRFNLDGFLVYDTVFQPQAPETRSYLQVFRSGIIEAVEVRNEVMGRFLPEAFDRQFNASVAHYLSWMRILNVQPPIVVMLSVLGARGYRLWVIEDHLPTALRSLGSNQPFDRDPLILPDVVIQSYDEPTQSAMKPILDALYQAGGWARCLNYGDDGQWSG